MDDAGESPRGLHAIRVLERRKDFTLDRLRDAAFDSYLTAFARLVPPLLAAYDSTPDAAPGADSLKARLAGPIAELRGWDFRWSAGSVATSLAVYWGDTLTALTQGDARTAGNVTMQMMLDQLRIRGFRDGTLNASTSEAWLDHWRRYLESQGVNPDAISAKGFGDTHPVASNDTPNGRSKNRRIEIVLEGPGAPGA